MMNEYDNVVLTKDFEDLKVGTKGTIVLKYDNYNFEVEFFSNDGETIGVYTITDDFIALDKI